MNISPCAFQILRPENRHVYKGLFKLLVRVVSSRAVYSTKIFLFDRYAKSTRTHESSTTRIQIQVDIVLPAHIHMALLRLLYNALRSRPFPSFGSITHILLRTPPLKGNRKASLHSLPIELLLEIFSFLELEPYILSHGVYSKWRHLLPSTQMDPIRERLLNLYHTIGNHPRHPQLPRNTRMDQPKSTAIRQGGARLVIQCTWPGLTFTRSDTDSPSRKWGVNWIAYRLFSPQLSALVYKQDSPDERLIQGHLIWRVPMQTDWLIFEQDDPHLFGCVYHTDVYYHPDGRIPYFPTHLTGRDRRMEMEDRAKEMMEEDSYYGFTLFKEGVPLIFDDWNLDRVFGRSLESNTRRNPPRATQNRFSSRQ